MERRSSQKSRRVNESIEKRIYHAEQLAKLSQPRKLVKINRDSEKPFKNLEYSKIPALPEINLRKEDMEADPIELFVRLEAQYEEYGAIKINAPPEWKPPFCFNFGEIGIKTRVQHLHKLKLGKPFRENEQAYNVRNFEMMALDFEKNYRIKTNPSGKKYHDQLEAQYWNLVHQNYDGPDWKYKTSVEYAADLPVNKLGSGFPISENHKSKDDNFNYYKNLFNLNNTFKSPNSILSVTQNRKQHISGVTVPWVYMGMMFSTFCWHVEDLWLNSVNYNHKGGIKLWYIIPKKYKEKFDNFVFKKTGRTDLLNRINFMIDPLEVLEAGIPVYKTLHRPGEFVLTFYKAYHAGFSLGFNIGEAVNFASPISLTYIDQAMRFVNSQKECRPAVLSLEWLIYQNKMQQQTNKMHSKQNQRIIDEWYNKILKSQHSWLTKLSKEYQIELGPKIDNQHKYDKNSCSKCRNYVYLSSLRCKECNRNYCQNDFTACCQGQYELIYREPNCQRKWILELQGNQESKRKGQDKSM